MLSKSAFDFILHITNYFHGHWEDPEWGKSEANQLLIALAIRELTEKITDEEMKNQINTGINRVISKNSQAIESRIKTDTPLNNFIARLADPEFLERFQNEPLKVMEQFSLPEEYKFLFSGDYRGLLRLAGIQELERTGFSPLVSDKFKSNVQVANMDINTNDFHTTNITIDTHVTTTITNHNDNTTTHTKHWPDIAIDSIDSAIHYFNTGNFDKKGSLYVVGGGIKAIYDMTLGTEAQIRSADKVLYCVADPATERRIHYLNPTAKSLYDLYGNDKARIITYKEMVDNILGYVRRDLRVCVVFYGHPGVFAWSTHQSVRIAREEGYRAEMTPGISAEASLFADLGIDPSHFGCLTLDATDFLIHRRTIDPHCHVLLWQVECAGDSGFNFSGYKKHNFPVLIEELCRTYPEDHPVVVYDASSYSHLPPRILKLQLSTITKEHLSGISTLYLPPAETPKIDWEMCKRLDLNIAKE